MIDKLIIHYEVPRGWEEHSGEWALNLRRKLAEHCLHAMKCVRSQKLDKSDAYTEKVNECSEVIPFSSYQCQTFCS